MLVDISYKAMAKRHGKTRADALRDELASITPESDMRIKKHGDKSCFPFVCEACRCEFECHPHEVSYNRHVLVWNANCPECRAECTCRTPRSASDSSDE